MDFVKLQGAGNDFILVETAEANRDWSGLSVRMCDRHYGAGADGLLLLMPSLIADYRMRMFNPDGSEAEACGNGLRCLVKYIVTRKLPAARPGEILHVETKEGTRKAILKSATAIQVDMGLPRFKAAEIPVALEKGGKGQVDIKSMLNYTITLYGRELPLNLVSMGNPHAVYFSEQPVESFPLAQIGPEVEKHSIFPNRVNFEVARLLSRRLIDVRVWERGAGETLACGTGACAVAVAAYLKGMIDEAVTVKLPGGELNVEWDGKGKVLLGGGAEIVFTGHWPEEA